MSAAGNRTGRCACGALVFTLQAAPSDVIACHCVTCRRWSGYLWGALRVPRGDLSISGETLRWWTSSASARRGFCAACGSSLFFDETDASHIGVAPGALDDATGLRTTTHIGVAEAAAYTRPDPDAKQVDDPKAFG